MFDILVIGAGPGGYVAAIKASQLGAKVGIIEKEKVGGVCLNHGCIPAKTLIKSSKFFHSLSDAAKFGVKIEGTVKADYKAMVERKDKVVTQLTSGVAYLLKKNKVELITGTAEVISAHKVKVGEKVYETKKLVIATGSSPFLPPIEGLKEGYALGNVVTSRELLTITYVPNNLVIIGGGVIGVEFATIFASLGSKVTIIEMMPAILPQVDEDITKDYTLALRGLGVEVITSAQVVKVSKAEVSYKLGEAVNTTKSDLTLVAVGTRANSQGLEALNLKMDKGNIVTDEYLRTSNKDVYAIGDVNGKMMLAHVASHEGIIAVTHALGKPGEPMDYTLVPLAIYGSPEIASVGLTEKEVKAAGIEYKVSSFPLKASGKALADGEKDGFMKLITGKKYGELLGAHLYAYNASELISELVLGMKLEVTAEELAATIHPHPSLSEGIMEASLAAVDQSINY